MRITLLAATLAAARTRPTALRAALRRRGGDVVENAASSCKLSPGRAEELAALNEREHAAECIKVEGEAWSGDLEPDSNVPETDKFAIPDWYLPDLDAELRNNGDVEIHVTKTPLFSQEESRSLRRFDNYAYLFRQHRERACLPSSGAVGFRTLV